MTETWEAVARALAARLAHHDHCEEHLDDPRVHAAECPSCDDRVAMARYHAKAQPVTRPATKPLPAAGRPGVTVSRRRETLDLAVATPVLWGLAKGRNPGEILWHLDQGESVAMSWCGVRQQFRHTLFVRVHARDATLDDLTCTRCKAAVRQGSPRSLGH